MIDFLVLAINSYAFELSPSSLLVLFFARTRPQLCIKIAHRAAGMKLKMAANQMLVTVANIWWLKDDLLRVLCLETISKPP